MHLITFQFINLTSWIDTYPYKYESFSDIDIFPNCWLQSLHWYGVTIPQAGKIDWSDLLQTTGCLSKKTCPSPFSLHGDPSLFRFGSLDILVAETHAVLIELVQVGLDNLGHDEGGLLDPLPLPSDCYHHIICSHLEKAYFTPILYVRFLDIER